MSDDKKWTAKIDFALQSISDMEMYVAGRTLESFSQDKMRRQAVERCLEIIGEAVRHIPDSHKAEWPGIPWSDIYGMRNILSHGYDIVDERTVWDTAVYDLAGLKEALAEIRKKSRE